MMLFLHVNNFSKLDFLISMHLITFTLKIKPSPISSANSLAFSLPQFPPPVLCPTDLPTHDPLVLIISLQTPPHHIHQHHQHHTLIHLSSKSNFSSLPKSSAQSFTSVSSSKTYRKFKVA